MNIRNEILIGLSDYSSFITNSEIFFCNSGIEFGESNPIINVTCSLVILIINLCSSSFIANSENCSCSQINIKLTCSLCNLTVNRLLLKLNPRRESNMQSLVRCSKALAKLSNICWSNIFVGQYV